MIDRLRSVGSIELPRFLERLLDRSSADERSGDSGADGPASRDPWTPEERVLTLLDDNGGRMWQQGIVSETGYSEAKVSRLLTDLEEDGIVDRNWSGGEKLVVLDRDLTDAAPTEPGSSPSVRR